MFIKSRMYPHTYMPTIVDYRMINASIDTIKNQSWTEDDVFYFDNDDECICYVECANLEEFIQIEKDSFTGQYVDFSQFQYREVTNL